METLSDYFSYNNDYSDIEKIYYNLSKKMKIIHESGKVIPNFSSSAIVFDDGFDYARTQEASNFEAQKKENILSFSKLFLGTYLSLSTGFRDFSGVSNEWFIDNIYDICSAITAENFHDEYFTSIFSNESSEYYCDYLDKKRQASNLNGRSAINSYSKVLRNSASAFYQPADEETNNDFFDPNNKAALVNELFYPILLFCSLIIIICFVIIFVK